MRAPALGRLRRAVLTADALDQLRQLITLEVMQRVLALMNSPLGFLTDRAPGNKRNLPPYSSEVVRECFLVSLLEGVDPVGNEWNIIAGRYYCTQNGWRHKLADLEGLTDLRLSPGTPLMHQGRMVVRFGASWKYRGTADRLQDHDDKPGRVIVVRTDDVNAVDQILGKAEAKALKAIWRQIHGSAHAEAVAAIEEELEEQVEEALEHASPAWMSAEQQEELEQLLRETRTSVQSMLETFAAASLAELTREQYQTARMKLLHRRLDQQVRQRPPWPQAIRAAFTELGYTSDEQSEVLEGREIASLETLTAEQGAELLAWLDEQVQQARQRQEARASG